MTNFFEPIKASAAHIYHSALELSPLSSIVRRSYYHQRQIPFPKVVLGTPDSWDQCISISGSREFYTWSACGRFVAARTKEIVEIWDALSSELLSTLTTFTADSFLTYDAFLTGQPTFSPDGRSLACTSNHSLIVWDIQTGGVAREIVYDVIYCSWLVWSLDGGTICIVGSDQNRPFVWVCDVASGITTFPRGLESPCTSHLWVHNNTFWIMTAKWHQGYIIDIYEVGSILTKIESFHLHVEVRNKYIIQSFSPTYRISTSCHGRHETHHHILDIQNSEYLLKEVGEFNSQCFSSDGNLFAASSGKTIHIWTYTSVCYTQWKEISIQEPQISLLFSPTSSSLLSNSSRGLRVWHLDGPLTSAYPDHHQTIIALSHCGTYMATSHWCNNTVTTTHLPPQTPPCLIDTEMYVIGLALTSNVLLVLDHEMITAWLLTEEGVVGGVSIGGRAGRSNSIFTVPLLSQAPRTLEFYVGGQIVIIKKEGTDICAYHTKTGEVFKPTQVLPLYSFHSLGVIWNGEHLSSHTVDNKDNQLVSQPALQGGWVKVPKGKCRLWIPIEWRELWGDPRWLSDNMIMWFGFEWRGRDIVLML